MQIMFVAWKKNRRKIAFLNRKTNTKIIISITTRGRFLIISIINNILVSSFCDGFNIGLQILYLVAVVIIFRILFIIQDAFTILDFFMLFKIKKEKSGGLIGW